MYVCGSPSSLWFLWCMHTWQKQSKYQPQFFLNCQNWFLKVLYIQQIKNQTLLTDFPILQNLLFLHVLIRWVMQTICFDFANMHHVIASKFSENHLVHNTGHTLQPLHSLCMSTICFIKAVCHSAKNADQTNFSDWKFPLEVFSSFSIWCRDYI